MYSINTVANVNYDAVEKHRMLNFIIIMLKSTYSSYKYLHVNLTSRVQCTICYHCATFLGLKCHLI